jgi:predicted NACHT family NTPase
VLLAAAEWNPSSEVFHEFVASQLNFGYPALSSIHPEASCELVSRRRLIVILDGLDEVPSRRRVQMLQTLNTSLVDEDAVIVTCRTSDYREVVNAAEDRLTGLL